MAFGNEIQSLLVEQVRSKADGSKELTSEFVAQMKSETDALALDTVSKAASLLTKATDVSMPQSVIDAYERIITRASTR